MKLDRQKALEELAKRNQPGFMTATEVMLRHSAIIYSDDHIADHVMAHTLPVLCGPYGKRMP